MNFERVAEIEKLHKLGEPSDLQMKTYSLLIPSDKEVLEVTACRPANAYGTYHYNTKVPKEKIVLHHTAGHLKGDLRALTREDHHVSTAFVIARDGTIYQLHHSNKWSYHLGRKSVGGNKKQSQKSIGIELSNYGYLLKNGEQLETPYTKSKEGGSADVYCALEDQGLYTQLPKKYRQHHYYATFTDAQYEQLILLLKYLTRTYNIPVAFLSEDIRYTTTEEAAAFNGILSHVNYRKDKYDLGPAFDWDRVITAMNAPVSRSIPLFVQALTALFRVRSFFKKLKAQKKAASLEEPIDTPDLKEVEEQVSQLEDQVTELKEDETEDTSKYEEVVTEDDIEEDMPLKWPRSASDNYDEDGPAEIPYDYFNNKH